MQSVWSDVRYALRTMSTHGAFTLAALLTLALGIGATTAMFSLVYGVLLRPLPYAEPDQIMRVYDMRPGDPPVPLANATIDNVTIDAWASTAKTIESWATYGVGPTTLGEQDPGNVEAGTASPSLFPLLRIRPLVGRFFEERDALEGAESVTILSYGLWQQLYSGSAAVVGQSIVLNGQRHRIIGVAPHGFAFPTADTALWVPAKATPSGASQGVYGTWALVRLRPGRTPQQAAAEATAVARSVAATKVQGAGTGGNAGGIEVHVRPLIDQFIADVRPALLLLMTGVALVLFVACANVANLLLARGETRRRELAVRSALGASRRRLMQQLLTESCVLAIAGGLLGLAVAWASIRLLPVVAPAGFPRIESVRLDWRVILFALAASLLASVLAGGLPAARVTPRLESVLRTEDRRSVGGSGWMLRGSLLIIEAALAVLLLVNAGLLIHSFVRLISVDGGFDPANVLTAQVSLPEANVRPPHPTPFFDTLLPRLAQTPGVRAVGAGNMMPFGTEGYTAQFDLPSGPSDGGTVRVRATNWRVTPGFAAALGIRVIEGRFLELSDASASTDVLVVNEAFVRAYLRDGKPVVGRSWRAKDDPSVTEIVGVVANVLKDGLDRQPMPAIYRPVRPAKLTTIPVPSIIVRTTGDPVLLAPELRRLVHETDPRASLDRVGSLSSRLSASVARPRFAAWILTVFAGLALAVAATGLYGVLSYSIAEQRREIGVRAALGASRGRLIAMVLRRGLGFTIAGLVLGVAAAAATSRLLGTLLFGVTPYDTVTYLVAPAILLLLALVACVGPARRAAITDPAEVLRGE